MEQQLLKGEFPTVYADESGLILTNYRLFDYPRVGGSTF